MASEDVIELGSSDEESQPAPKKANINKRRRLNAMVHIPQGVTIKPTKSVNHNINPIKKLMSKGLTVTKVNSTNQIASSSRNGKSTSKPVRVLSQLPNMKTIQKPVSGNTSLVNPMNVINKLNNSVVIVKTPNPKMPPNFPIRVQNLKNLNSRNPETVVVKKVTGMPGIKIMSPRSLGSKRPATSSISNVKKKQKVAPKPVVTVNLDDEEVPTTSTASPQWYLRPEDAAASEVTQKEQKNEEQSLEKQNNEEPIKFVEITIEDSPIKPVHNKRTHEIGAELAITIDDSPVKLAASKEKASIDSDNENTELTPKDKLSKKKLDYPKDIQNLQNVETTTIEIELEPIEDMETASENNDKSKIEDACMKDNEDVVINKESDKQKKKEVIKNDNIIEIFESPAKTLQSPPRTPKKDFSQIQKIKPMEIATKPSLEPSEFHPVYQEFIDLCFKIENSNDMKTIVEKKIKNYYRQVPNEYTESEEFVELVQSKLFAMKASPEKLYLYIKDVVDELNLQRKMAKAKPTVQETRNLEAEKFQYGEESEFDSKRQRQIRKLEKTLKKLHRAIQKLEEQEVDFDDEEDSVYLLTERYKERMVRVHAKFCQLTNTKMPSEPRIQIQPRPGQPAGPAKRIEKWINKKVPVGKPLPFPDFHDVLRCVREANTEDKLGWNEADVMEEARDLFTRCGKKLQRRRQENEWRLAASRISAETDPAEISDELKKKLDSNKQVASKKETEVFNKYADKQSQLKLEAVEIGDKEAEESPVESEDEEPQEENSNLEDKEKRKERLRRLINEKSKKSESKEKELKETTTSLEQATSKDDSKTSTEHAEKKESSEMDVDPLLTEVNKDSMKDDSVPQKANAIDNLISEEKVHSLGEDSSVGSDVDELHLLQKLHSDAVNTSTLESTDSDSPIDISDTMTSSDQNKKLNSDVISIENSSYSETETRDDFDDVNIKGVETKSEKEEIKQTENDKVIISDRLSGEIECSSAGIQLNKTNNEEYNESVESILLASTDEEGDDGEKNEANRSNNDESMSLKDDSISIGDTEVEHVIENKTETISSSKSTLILQSIDVEEVNDGNSVESNCKNVDEAEETTSNIIEITNKIENSEEVIKEIDFLESGETGYVQITKDEAENSLTTSQQLKPNYSDCSDIVKSVDVSEETLIYQVNKDVAKKSLATDQQLNPNDSVCTDKVKSVDDSEETLILQKKPLRKSDDFQEIVQEQSDSMNNSSMEKLELDHSQEAVMKYEQHATIDVQNSCIIENKSVETIESEKSQEVVSEDVTESTDCKENDAEKDQCKLKPYSESYEIHELTDSNSPDQTELVDHKFKSNHVQNTSNEAEICRSSAHSDNDDNLESTTDSLRSDFAVNEKLASTAAAVNE